MAAQRLEPEKPTARRKTSRKKSGPKLLLVPKNLDYEHHESIQQRIRSLKNRVLKAASGIPVETKFPREFVLAATEWIEQLRALYPSLAREFEGLAAAFLALGLPNAFNYRESLEENFFEVRLMPPDPIQDLFADRVEWREVDK